jgi:hypothetical protein
MSVIDILYEEWGFGRHDLAVALNVPEAVIYRWRRGSEPNADEVARADQLLDFVLEVREFDEDPAAWMTVRVVKGYTVTRLDLYRAGYLSLLRTNAQGDISDVDMLYAFDRDWKLTYWTDYEVGPGTDGHPVIVRKEQG